MAAVWRHSLQQRYRQAQRLVAKSVESHVELQTVNTVPRHRHTHCGAGAAYLDNASKDPDTLISNLATRQVQLCNGLVGSQTIT